MAVIIPETPELFSETLKLALDLSDRPRDVKIVDVRAIEVPDEVADRINRYHELGDESQDADPEAPVKRRPGRPRKNPLPEESA